MEGNFNCTAVKRERGAAEMSAQIDGLRRRIGDLQGEIKILKAKIAGQRAAIREKDAEIIALNRNLDMTKKRLAIAVQLLNETNRVATKMKCWEFPVNLKIDIRQFLGKDITPCEGGAE